MAEQHGADVFDSHSSWANCSQALTVVVDVKEAIAAVFDHESWYILVPPMLVAMEVCRHALLVVVVLVGIAAVL